MIEENGGAFARVHAKSDEIKRGKKCCSNRQRNEEGGESMEKEKRKKNEILLGNLVTAGNTIFTGKSNLHSRTLR